jgi:hypothetical protein
LTSSSRELELGLTTVTRVQCWISLTLSQKRSPTSVSNLSLKKGKGKSLTDKNFKHLYYMYESFYAVALRQEENITQNPGCEWQLGLVMLFLLLLGTSIPLVEQIIVFIPIMRTYRERIE